MPDPYLPELKTFDASDPNPCAGCSNCCEYVSIEIDKPTQTEDFSFIIWYLIHKDVWVYIDDENGWYVQFNTPCEKLEDRRCSAYDSRPLVCREYQPEECVRYVAGAPEKIMFRSDLDLYRYLAKKRPAQFRKLKELMSIPHDEEELIKPVSP